MYSWYHMNAKHRLLSFQTKNYFDEAPSESFPIEDTSKMLLSILL